MSEFKNKWVLVTGASEGIGRATAIQFGKAGANLIVVARNQKRLEELKQELQSFRVEVQVEALDLAKESEVAALFSRIQQLDVAINNAGTEGRIADICDLSLVDYDEVFNLNVRSMFQCLHHQVSHFRNKNKPGVIVNVSSIAGIRGIANSSTYVASKHAVIGLTVALALEQIGKGIRINCISPGSTDTPMIRRIIGDAINEYAVSLPMQRLASPDEVASTIKWLTSAEAKNIVGQNIVVDGGRTAGLL